MSAVATDYFVIKGTALKRSDYMSFTSLKELIELAEQGKTTIFELMIKTEVEQKGDDREAIIEKMSEQFMVMEEAVRKGTMSPVMSRTGLTGGDGNRLYQYAKNGISIINPFTLNVAANALAVSEVNAAMGRIVATPTAGSAESCQLYCSALDSGNFTGADCIVDIHCLCPRFSHCQ